MADFGPNKVFCPNFQIAISEILGTKISMIPTNDPKMKKFWQVRVPSSKRIGWFDMELP